MLDTPTIHRNEIEMITNKLRFWNVNKKKLRIVHASSDEKICEKLTKMQVVGLLCRTKQATISFGFHCANE